MSRIKRRILLIDTESLLLQLEKFKHTQVLSTTTRNKTAETTDNNRYNKIIEFEITTGNGKA
jgi:hypothetical protein